MSTKAIDVVDKLNDSLWGEEVLHEENFHQTFSYRYYSTFEQIYYNDILIWCSENEEREWLEENNDYEDLYFFCRKRFSQEMNDLIRLNTLVQLKSD